MKLWIRSQDKEILVLAKGFELQSPSYNNGCQIFAVWQNNYQCVGNYKSKKRALEVLDEIQNILNPMIVFKNYNCTKDMLDNIKEAGACVVSDNAHIEQIQTCIYEMPKE